MSDLKETSKITDEEALLRDLKGRFLRAYNSKEKWVKEKRKWSRFYDGDQWTEEERHILKERGQPDVTVNRIGPKIDSIVGMELGLAVKTKAYDRGAQDFEKAKFISEAIRQIEYLTNFDQKESDAFEDQVIDGLGWYEVGIRWSGLEAEPYTEKLDNEDVFEDPDHKKDDMSDAKDLSKSVWVAIEDAKELFPGNDMAFDELVDGPTTTGAFTADPVTSIQKPDGYKFSETGVPGEDFKVFIDRKLRRIRITTTYYRTSFRRSFITAPNLGTIEVTDTSKPDVKVALETFKDAQRWDQLGHRLNAATFTWGKLLEHKKDIKPWDEDAKFWQVKVPGRRSRDKNKQWMYYGLVKNLMDPQKEVNKRRSKMLHILNTNQIEMEEGAVDDIEAARIEAAKPDGVIIRRPGFAFNRETRTDLAASQFQLLQESKSEIDSAGIRGEVEGVSRATSGRDFQLRQQQATQSLRKFFSTLRGARRQVGLLWLDIIQQYWTSERLVRITDDPDAGTIVLNQKVTDPVTGKVKTLNNVSLGKYDIIIDEAPETMNLASETFSKLADLLGKGVPIPLDMLIEQSDIPNKKKILDRMQQQQQAQAQTAQMQGAAPPPAA